MGRLGEAAAIGVFHFSTCVPDIDDCADVNWNLHSWGIPTCDCGVAGVAAYAAKSACLEALGYITDAADGPDYSGICIACGAPLDCTGCAASGYHLDGRGRMFG